jgi:hypothetical protein
MEDLDAVLRVLHPGVVAGWTGKDGLFGPLLFHSLQIVFHQASAFFFIDSASQSMNSVRFKYLPIPVTGAPLSTYKSYGPVRTKLVFLRTSLVDIPVAPSGEEN